MGTTSLVPLTECRTAPGQRLHYLICDVDEENVAPTVNYLLDVLDIHDMNVLPTQHGWHIYTNRRMPWRSLIWELQRVPGIDMQWLTIGLRRGYLYLADKDYVKLRWPVVRMELHESP